MVSGKATARLTFDAWPEGKVIPTIIELNVLAGKTISTREPISSPLKRELTQPHLPGYLHRLQFSPDGKRIIGSSYPGGVIQVWDADTGKRLARVDTDLGTESHSEAFLLSKDGTTAYVAEDNSHPEMLAQDGKRMARWTFTGRIQAWDIATGQPRAVYQHDPPRLTVALRLSPDGRKLLALEEPPGVFAGRPDRVTTLWDVATKKPSPLPASAGWGVFSPDSRTIAYAELDKNRYARAIKVLDIATGQQKQSIPIPQAASDAILLGFSLDGKMLLGSVRDYGEQRQSNTWEVTLKLWDVATGQELLAIPGSSKSDFSWHNFSPDGRLCAIAAYSFRDPTGKLLLVDLEKKQLRKTILLDSPRTAGQKVFVGSPAFSPDGKWLAVVSRVGPDKRVPGLQPEDVPQPRIHLIDAATGEVRETCIAPPGMPTLLSFSPDGKTLAMGDRGKVLLWDMRQPPGSVTSKK
jgi:WD40 repeat protein